MLSLTTIIKQDIILHTDQNDVWVYDGVQTLTLYDQQLVKKKTTLSLTFNLYDMTLTASKDILATNYNNKCVVKISPFGDVITLFSTAPLAPCGICINNRGNIVIGLQDVWAMTTFLGAYKLVVFSPDGSAILQEIKDGADGKPLFREEIRQVKQNGNGDYMVSERYRIVCVSSEGQFRWDYIVESLSMICGMVCDKYDNVIIAEFWNNKILLLSSEGKLVTTLLTEEGGIRNPRSLSLDRHGHLWIGQDKSLEVVNYLK